MSVKVVDKQTGTETIGKYASVKEGQVALYSGIMSDRKGGWRGCGRRQTFSADAVTMTADSPDKEIKQE